ncbi:MAG: PorV/PorQ family protein [Ignavibacteriae bacterium]|nr:PorV/PorQ family protein [Ignavibacteriota bacterium]
MIKKIFALNFIIVFSVFAQNAGESGLSFLKIGPSAKTIAVSDIGFLDGNVSSVYYNPAAVNLNNTASIMFSHQAWIQDLSCQVVGSNFILWGIPLSISANTTKIKDFEVRTQPSEKPQSTFDVNYFYGNLSSGFGLTENIYFGFSIKYLYESIFTDDATGFGYDLGLIYADIFENLNFGLSVRNLGNMNNLRFEKTKLPSDLLLNATYKFSVESASLEIIPVFGIQNYFDAEIIHIHFGSEIGYDKQFFLRLGYVNGIESRNISFGAGVFYNGFNLDYAFTPFNYNIGNANTISLQYVF